MLTHHIKAIESQHGIIVECAYKTYSFSHVGFQEYFTARYLIDHIHKGALEALIRNHCTDDNWREIFCLTSEMLDDAGKFFEIFFAVIEKMFKNDKYLIQFFNQIPQTIKQGNNDISELISQIFDFYNSSKEIYQKEQTICLTRFLEVIILFVECLNLAMLSDRKIVEWQLISLLIGEKRVA